MRIILLSDDYLPGSTRIHARMMHTLGRELVSRGHSVVVLTPGTDSQKSVLCREVFEGIEVWRFRGPSTRGGKRWQRAVRETLLSVRAIKAVKSSSLNAEFDVCINYSPTIFFGPLVYWLGRKGAFSYLVLRDFFPQWVIDAGLISKYSPVTMFFRFIEFINYKSANVIGVQSPANIAAFKAMSPYDHPCIEVLYNWGNSGEGCSDPEYGENLISRLGLNDKVILFYGGNIGHAQDMENLMRMAKRLLSFTQAHMLLVGQGDEFDLVQRLKKNWQLDNVTILPSVNQVEYDSILMSASIGLFSLAKTHSAHNFPGKLLGYMAASLPILGSVNAGNDVITVINESKSGLVAENGDDDTLFVNAMKLISSEELRSQMGQASNKVLTEQFSVVNAVEQILGAYEKRVNG